jgi:hypothetical protein
MNEDSDDDDDDDAQDVLPKLEDIDDKVDKTHLAPEDAQVAGELQEAIGRIRVSTVPFHDTLLHLY